MVQAMCSGLTAVQVVTPASGGPADKAGVKSRDIVEAIDGRPTKGLSLYDAGDMLQGGEGSQVGSAHCTYSLISCTQPCAANTVVRLPHSHLSATACSQNMYHM